MSPWLVCRVAFCCATSRHLSFHDHRLAGWSGVGQGAILSDRTRWRYGGNAPLGSMRFLTTEETCLRVPAAQKPPEIRLRQPPRILSTRPLIVLDPRFAPQPNEKGRSRKPPPPESGRLQRPPRIGSAPPLTKCRRWLIPQRIGWDHWPNRPLNGLGPSHMTLRSG